MPLPMNALRHPLLNPEKRVDQELVVYNAVRLHIPRQRNVLSIGSVEHLDEGFERYRDAILEDGRRCHRKLWCA